LAVAATALAGCVQSGGAGIFRRDAPPLWQPGASAPSLPAFLRPTYRRSDQPVVAAQPSPIIIAQPVATPAPLPAPMAAPIPAPVAAPAVVQPMPLAVEEIGYALDSGDRLRVVVFGQEGLTASYAVDIGGNITMPLIGAVPARGRTPAQLQAAIAAMLRQGYVREPHVAVEVETYRPFFILGEVTLPGQYPYVANMTVETAVAIAGGYTPRAQKYRIEINRQIGGLTEKRVVSPNYPVYPGDTIKIAERWF
jgi:polysaccharide export outer membrane protein